MSYHGVGWFGDAAPIDSSGQAVPSSTLTTIPRTSTAVVSTAASRLNAPPAILGAARPTAPPYDENAAPTSAQVSWALGLVSVISGTNRPHLSPTQVLQAAVSYRPAVGSVARAALHDIVEQYMHDAGVQYYGNWSQQLVRGLEMGAGPAAAAAAAAANASAITTDPNAIAVAASDAAAATPGATQADVSAAAASVKPKLRKGPILVVLGVVAAGAGYLLLRH
jgi:hypothetical protein